MLVLLTSERTINNHTNGSLATLVPNTIKLTRTRIQLQQQIQSAQTIALSAGQVHPLINICNNNKEAELEEDNDHEEDCYGGGLAHWAISQLDWSAD